MWGARALLLAPVDFHRRPRHHRFPVFVHPVLSVARNPALARTHTYPNQTEDYTPNLETHQTRRTYKHTRTNTHARLHLDTRSTTHINTHQYACVRTHTRTQKHARTHAFTHTRISTIQLEIEKRTCAAHFKSTKIMIADFDKFHGHSIEKAAGILEIPKKRS